MAMHAPNALDWPILPGLKWGEQRPGADNFGKVFAVVDERLPGAEPTSKIARVVSAEMLSTKGWAEFCRRLEALTSMNAAHLSLPTEVWGQHDGTVILISRQHGESLRRKLGERNGAGLSAAELDELVGQLVTALAGMHAVQLPHGDVRPANVFLDPDSSNAVNAWLVDAPVGTLSYLSGGKILDGEARFYFPPEWQGAVKEPTCQADLYALGLTLVEVAAGKEANPQRNSAGGAGNVRTMALASLQDATVSRKAKQFVAELLAVKEDDRFASGIAALRRWEQYQNGGVLWQSWRRWLYAIVLLCVFVVLILAFGAYSRWQALVAENQDLKMQIELRNTTGLLEVRDRLDKLHEKVTADQSETQKDLVQLHSDFQDLRQKISAGDADPAEQEAQKHWQHELAKQHPDKNFKAVSDIESFGERAVKSAELQLSPVALSKIQDWHRQLNGVATFPAAEPWWKHDKDFRDALIRLATTPWERPTAQTRLDTLNRAARQWKNWADSTHSTAQIDEILKETTRDVQILLRRWFDEYVERSGQGTFRFQFIKGASDDWGANRYTHLSSGKHSLGPIAHTWSSATSHVYPTTSPDPAIEKMNWAVDQPFRVIVEADGGWRRLGTYRPNIIDASFNGPFAVWLASIKKIVATGKNRLDFKILDIPGPPVEVIEALDEASLSRAADALTSQGDTGK